jgi:hypothetical protein
MTTNNKITIIKKKKVFKIKKIIKIEQYNPYNDFYVQRCARDTAIYLKEG